MLKIFNGSIDKSFGMVYIICYKRLFLSVQRTLIVTLLFSFHLNAVLDMDDSLMYMYTVL